MALICSEFPELEGRPKQQDFLKLLTNYFEDFQKEGTRSSKSNLYTRLPRVVLLFNSDIVAVPFLRDVSRVLSAQMIECTPGKRQFIKFVETLLSRNQLNHVVPDAKQIAQITDMDLNKTLVYLKHWGLAWRYKKSKIKLPNQKSFSLFDIIGKVLYNKRKPEFHDGKEESVRYKGADFERNKDRFYFNLKSVIHSLRSMPNGLDVFCSQIRQDWPLFTSSYKEMMLIGRCMGKSKRRTLQRNKAGYSSRAVEYKEEDIYLESLAFMTKAATPAEDKYHSFTTRKRHPKTFSDDQSEKYNSRKALIKQLMNEIYPHRSTQPQTNPKASLQQYRYAPGECPFQFGRQLPLMNQADLEELEEISRSQLLLAASKQSATQTQADVVRLTVESKQPQPQSQSQQQVTKLDEERIVPTVVRRPTLTIRSQQSSNSVRLSVQSSKRSSLLFDEDELKELEMLTQNVPF